MPLSDTDKSTDLDSRRPSSPDALLGNQRASLVGSILDRRRRDAASLEPAVTGLVDAPWLDGTAAGWTGNRS